MIRKLLSAGVAECYDCGTSFVYNIVQGLPPVCRKCGCPANKELTQEQRQRMEQMRQGPQQQSQSFHFRF